MNIRKLASEAIEKVLYKGAYVNIVINEYLSKFEFGKEEKGLFTRLVMGTVEKKITLAFYLEPYLRKKQKPWVNVILLMSVYQIVFMNVENHYVVNEAVNLGNLKDKFIGGFINGVLRNLLRNELREIPRDDEIKYLSIKYSYPTWLVSYLLKDYKFNVVEKLLEKNDEVKKHAIRVNTLKASLEEVCNVLDQENIAYTKHELVENGLIVEEALMNHNLFKEGKITIQDVASQMVSEVLDPKEGSLVIDLCSAPGSKTSHIAALMNNSGRIYACDIHQHKMKLMKSNFKRLGVENVILELIDARLVRKQVKSESFDYVLADMPCSGLGVLGHKVDLKYNISYESIEEIIKLQSEILEASYELIKKNGYLVVSTCTINKSENEEQIKEFTKKHPDMQIEYEKTILPFEYETDGFYICKLKKGELNEA